MLAKQPNEHGNKAEPVAAQAEFQKDIPDVHYVHCNVMQRTPIWLALHHKYLEGKISNGRDGSTGKQIYVKIYLADRFRIHQSQLLLLYMPTPGKLATHRPMLPNLADTLIFR